MNTVLDYVMVAIFANIFWMLAWALILLCAFDVEPSLIKNPKKRMLFAISGGLIVFVLWIGSEIYRLRPTKIKTWFES